LPQIFFVGRRPLGTKKHYTQVSTIQFHSGGLNQERESKVFREASGALRAQEVDNRHNLVMIGHKVVAAFTPGAAQEFYGAGLVCVLDVD
jgi:hypothetical protein